MATRLTEDPVQLTEDDVNPVEQPVELTEADVNPVEQPVELTEADVTEPVQLTEQDVSQPVQLTDADVQPQPEPVKLTEADVQATPAAEQPGGPSDILPSFEQASAGTANMLRGIAQAPITLADKALASAQYSERVKGLIPDAAKAAFNPMAIPEAVNKFAWHLATGGVQDKYGMRQAIGDVRKKIDAWRESNLGYRDEQGRPATGDDWGVTFGAQAANSLAEVYLAKYAARAAGAAPAEDATGAPILKRLAALRPSALSIIYGGQQAESTAQKAEYAGRGAAEQVGMGAATGAWETAVESVSQLFGLQATAENAVGKSIAKSMRERALNVLAEGGEEFAQQAGTAGMEKLDRINDSTWAEIGQQSAIAFALGLASAGAAEGGSAAAQQMLTRAHRRTQETVDTRNEKRNAQRPTPNAQRPIGENESSTPTEGLAQQAENEAYPAAEPVPSAQTQTETPEKFVLSGKISMVLDRTDTRNWARPPMVKIPNTVYALHSLEVQNESEKGQGLGTKALEIAKKYATKNALPIYLEARATDDGKQNDLNRFYEKNGFKRVEGLQDTFLWTPPERSTNRTLTPEQEAQATKQAEENAAKDYAPRKVMGANVSDALTESNAVKAMVLEFGGIRMDGTEDQRGIPVAFRSKKETAQTLDQMLTEIQHGPNGAKYADWTTDDLIEALKGNETDRRKRFSERQADPQERAWLKSAWTVAPENLALGFSFKVKGIPYRVVDSDETGYVIERTDGKDAGWAIRLDYGKLMNIDGGTLTNSAGKRLTTIKNYADPEQVRVWQEAGAEEAAQKGEGFSTAEDEDQPFRMTGETQNAQRSTPNDQLNVTEAKPVAQIRVVRRGYDENREAADDPTFTQWAQNPVDLPELVEMATDLMDGNVPRVLKSMSANSNAAGYVKFKGTSDAAGQAVFGRPEMIALLADNYKLVSDDEAEAMQAAAEAKAKEIEGDKTDADGVPLWKATAKTLFDETYYAEIKSRVAAGPRFAMAVIAHEIGHIADQAAKYGLVKPDRSVGKNRLNLIGRVAGMLSWTRDILADDPAGKTLSADEIRTLQGRARKNAKPDTRGKELMRAITEQWATMPELNELAAHPELVNMVNARSFRDALEYMAREKPVLSEWFSITTFPEQVRASMEALKSLTKQSKTSRHLGSAWFRAEFVKGLEAQRQAHLGKMYSELESLIAWWNSGEKTMMNKYFERPSEMFAEAFGVFLNNPGAVKKRAPMFWRTLLDYMGKRPEVQEWLDAFNQDMSRGADAKFDVRDARLTDMFSKARREQNRAVEQAGQAGVTKRLASDAARYMLSRKSGPLHALISTADAIGFGAITNRVGKWADQVENVAGLEKMFAGEMNEVGQILEEGGLNVEDFDKWAYLNMVAQSPAYTQRANPLGFHPQAAREQLEFLRKQMGDARANQLQKAVERFQRLWQTNVVDRVEGMYDADTMAKLRANPVYFTLMVGMDDAEIKAFQKALQTLNADQMLAYAQRTVNQSVFGQPVPGGIIKRVGTHRPAMSLFGATLLKGVRMINDATRNRLAIETRSLLETLKDPYFMDIPEGQTATDTRSQTVVRYFDNGVKKAYYAPKFVGHFIRGDNPSQAFNNGLEVLRKYTLVNVFKRLQTMWSIKFMATQPIADAKAWNTQMPGVRTPIGNIARGNVLGGLAQMIPASTWYLPSSVFPPNSRERLMRPAREVIRRFYKTGEIDPRLRDLVERGMTDLNGAFQGMSRIDPDAGEILQLFAGIKPSKALEVYQQDLNAFQRGWKKLEGIPAFGRIFQAAGRTAEGLQSEMQIETLANKLAGMEYLDAKFPQMSERDKRNWVLHAAGNPNFAARSGWDPFIDTFAWTFYNPAKEGYRSLYMAAKADPAGFMARAMWFNVAPNLIRWGATTGILAAVAETIIPHGATPEDEEDRKRYMDAFKNWLSWFRRIPSYFGGRRHVTIPLQPVGKDSVLCITIPQAQSMAPINSLINVMLDEMSQAAGFEPANNKGIERSVTSITDEVAGINFLSGTSRSAFAQVFGPIIEMLTTDKTNVYDPFYGRNVFDINEEALMAGGRYTRQAWPAWEKLGKNAWNNAFGSAIGRFDTKTPRSDMPSKTDLQKILSAPGISTLVGGLLRVTGGGEFERLQDLFSAEGQNRAYDNIMARKAALESIQDPLHRFPVWAAEKYTDDPVFQRNYNEYIISHDIYSDMSVEDRMLYSRSNPIWKRMMLLREQQKRSE